MPNDLKITLDKALEVEPELKQAYEQDERTPKVIDIGRKLEGLTRHASVHACGVVMAALLFGGLNAGGQYMQANADVGIDLISVIQALIIIFVAAPALIGAIYRVKTDASSTQISQGWGA